MAKHKKQTVEVQCEETQLEEVGPVQEFGLFPVQTSDILEEMEGNEAYMLHQREKTLDF
jgi:hypothetical protein